MEHLHFTAEQLEHMLALAKQGPGGTKFIEVDCPVHPYKGDSGKKGDAVGTVTMRVHARSVGLVSCEDVGYSREDDAGEVIMLNPPASAVEDVEAAAKAETLSEENTMLREENTMLREENTKLSYALATVKTAAKDPEAPPVETPENAKTEAPPADQDQPAEREPQVIAPEDVGKLEEVLPPAPAGDPPPDPFAS